MFVAPKITIAELLAYKTGEKPTNYLEKKRAADKKYRMKKKQEKQEEIAKEVYQWFFKSKKSKLKLK